MRRRSNQWLALTFLGILMACYSCSSIRKSPTSYHTSKQSRDTIMQLIKKVADWQIDSITTNGWRHPERDWTNGALYAGLVKYAALTKNERYYDFMKNVGEKYDWKLYDGKNRYHADFYCVGQLYCQLYLKYHDPKMIQDVQVLADTLLARPHTESLEWKNNVGQREWAWCDALFMGPPTLAMLAEVTGNNTYLDLCDKLWWKTTDYLYDPAEQLYFRDGSFLDKKEKNGKKVFWSRGNGWVMGGLVRVLENMPKHYPDRGRWEKLFVEMASKIISLQQTDGTWRASLLDPESYPAKETSGTAFYTYALAWGINHGLLNKEQYAPAVWKGWNALAEAVHPGGKLGYAQQIGAAPGHVTYEDTEVYAVGAFLLAGCEVVALL